MRDRFFVFLTAAIIAGLIGLAYWPVHAGAFVWDDQICLHTAAWLRQGEGWKQFLSANFCDWHSYFRPLIVAMFAAELRIFDVNPGAMHLISLSWHLINTLLVGLLAAKLSARFDKPRRQALVVGAVMLLYGLHPALIEPVAWISCRADLVLTFFVLLGLLANASIANAALRASAIAAGFFLASCAKESAITFPALLVLFDWILLDSSQRRRPYLEQLHAIWRRQWPVYLAVFAAGLAYLALRYAALGFLLHGSGTASALTLPARLQMAAYAFATYWRILAFPMIGLAPTHVQDATRFAALTPINASLDLAALTILVAGIYWTCKRVPLGYAILAISIALFPVLHILPVDFDPSVYHERYVMLGLALALPLMPLIVASIPLRPETRRSVTAGAAAIGVLWLGVAAMNIRVTLPLWSNETRLWQWDALQNPESQVAKINLLALDTYGPAKKHALADEFLADTKPCALCMINVAVLSMEEHDLTRAKTALDRAQDALTPASEPRVWQGFVLATARLHELQKNIADADEDYRDAIKMDPLDPKAHTAFALFLVRQGKTAEARALMNETLPLWPPDVREERRQQFERTLAAVAKSQQLHRQD